jgi:hypothetical protein
VFVGAFAGSGFGLRRVGPGAFCGTRRPELFAFAAHLRAFRSPRVALRFARSACGFVCGALCFVRFT